MTAFALNQVLMHPIGSDSDPSASSLRLYALLDAQQCQDHKPVLERLPPSSRGTLFSDKQTAGFMQDVAPYLLALPDEPGEAAKVFAGCGSDALLFLWSSKPFVELHKALTTLFEIRSEDGESGYLQFYRSENFHEIMKSRSALVQRLFDAADAYCCADEWSPHVWRRYSQTDGQVNKQTIKTGESS